jgi:ubiquinone/menaquinone biosynthesis C-methylase UbiE
MMVNDPYHKSARNYDKYVEPFNTIVRQIGLRMYPPQEGMRVLDVGCGTGTNLSLYHPVGCEVFGIDLSPAMVEMARKKLRDKAEIILGDASYMPYEDNFFDLVTTMMTLHEMPDQIRSTVISEMIRVSKPKGHILVTDFHPGPIRFPKGWMYKSIALVFEIAAGREHFKNYRQFLANGGLLGLITGYRLNVEKKKIVSGGNLGLFLLSIGSVE